MSLWGLISGSDAAGASKNAAQDTYGKQQAAIGGYQTYLSGLPGAYNDLGKGYDPYKSAGTDALSMLNAGLGFGGPEGSAKFTSAYQSTPGYTSGLAEGLKAATRQAQASGMGNSGAALKAATRYGGDYANKYASDYFNRLAGVANLGYGATGDQARLGATGYGLQAGGMGNAFGGQMQSAQTIGQGLVAGAQAEQDAFNNLLKSGTYIAGAALGGGGGNLNFAGGSSGGGGLSSLWGGGGGGYYGGSPATNPYLKPYGQV